MEKMNKLLLSIGLMLLLGGIVFSFLPHEVHNNVLGFIAHEHDEATPEKHEHGSHDTHRYLGYGLALAGLLLAVWGYKRK
jgi:hypothetical protein